jgi:hypothetical protein
VGVGVATAPSNAWARAASCSLRSRTTSSAWVARRCATCRCRSATTSPPCPPHESPTPKGDAWSGPTATGTSCRKKEADAELGTVAAVAARGEEEKEEDLVAGTEASDARGAGAGAGAGVGPSFTGLGARLRDGEGVDVGVERMG